MYISIFVLPGHLGGTSCAITGQVLTPAINVMCSEEVSGFKETIKLEGVGEVGWGG